MTMPLMLDAPGRRRSSAAMPGYHAWLPPRNKGVRYPGRTCNGGSVVIEASWRRSFETLMLLLAGVLFSVMVELLLRAGDRAARRPGQLQPGPDE